MATRCADDVEVISARIKELADENKPKCPITPDRLLYTCLRSGAKCGTNCPYHDDWIGPNG